MYWFSESNPTFYPGNKGLAKNNRNWILGSATTKAIVMASTFDSIEKAVLITSSYNEAERLASDFIVFTWRRESPYIFDRW